MDATNPTMTSADQESVASSVERSTSTGDLASSANQSTKESAPDSESDLRSKIIHEEERNVRRARILVGIAFFACTVAVSVTVYFFAKQSDQEAFEQAFGEYASDIMPSVKWETRYNIALMEQLSSTVTIASHLNRSTFPYHTDQEFEMSGGFVDGMGGIMAAAFAPLVASEEKEQWEEYAWAHQGWLETSAYLKANNPTHRDALHGTIQDHEHDRRLQQSNTVDSISQVIYRWEDGIKVPETAEPGSIFAPLWQVSPADVSVVNENLLADPIIKREYDVMRQVDHAVKFTHTEIKGLFEFLFDDDEQEQKLYPHGFIYVPVYKEFEANATTVGFLVAITPWSNLLDRLLPEGITGIIAVFKDSCGNSMSFELSSGKAKFLDNVDVHETEFDEFELIEPDLELYNETVDGLCRHDLHLYPSSKFRAMYDTNKPAVYAGVVALAFLVTGILLVVYDLMVNRRQNKVMKAASRTQAIVTSLFPKDIGRKLVEEAYNDSNKKKTDNWKRPQMGTGSQDKVQAATSSKAPLADLFPEATVLFADIVGFTAWSSMREPSQVFVLLETLYGAYDELATRRKVFKVETIGDCYVAVCGLPEARKDHAVVMVRFARDCLHAMHSNLDRLSVELGPDTTELGMRVGLHSGPITAGVLRGDRARFQLFGDTVNTCARMESTSATNRIQVSQETANLLIAAGKKSWVTPRENKVNAKGKGEMQTYWVTTKWDATTATRCHSISSSTEQSVSSSYDIGRENTELATSKRMERHERLVAWTVEIIQSLLKEIVARRQSIGTQPDEPQAIRACELAIQTKSGVPFDEIKNSYTLPKYTASKAGTVDPLTVELDSIVITQLHAFVQSISTMYHNNHFHNFDHAGHVTMSVVKLLKRIVAPTEYDDNQEALHDHTYGITSDPLTQFSVVLSALIHDVDHTGVTNAQLVREGGQLALHYKGKSIAEQNSIDLAWSLLMQDRFAQLRSILYTTTDEFLRLRQLLVHTVLATDIMDLELNKERKERWYQTFGTSEDSVLAATTSKDDPEIDRKAAIVIEHLMQASDVAHTMQHWHIYRKWNSRLFKEMYRAYANGRSATDPSENWYQGELDFFDFYIIPLAQKLKSCGVFGVSSDEYLDYARQNRAEWEAKGEEIVRNLRMEVVPR